MFSTPQDTRTKPSVMPTFNLIKRVRIRWRQGDENTTWFDRRAVATEPTRHNKPRVYFASLRVPTLRSTSFCLNPVFGI